MAKHKPVFDSNKLQQPGSSVEDQTFYVVDAELQQFIDAAENKKAFSLYFDVARKTPTERTKYREALGIVRSVGKNADHTNLGKLGDTTLKADSFQDDKLPIQLFLSEIKPAIRETFGKRIEDQVFQAACDSVNLMYPEESKMTIALLDDMAKKFIAFELHWAKSETSIDFSKPILLMRHILDTLVTETQRKLWVECQTIEQRYVFAVCRAAGGIDDGLFMAPPRLIKAFNAGADVREEMLDDAVSNRERWSPEVLNYINERIRSTPMDEKDRLTAGAAGYQSMNNWFDTRGETIEKRRSDQRAEAERDLAKEKAQKAEQRSNKSKVAKPVIAADASSPTELRRFGSSKK